MLGHKDTIYIGSLENPEGSGVNVSGNDKK